MTLRLNGSTSGYTEIDAPAVAGSNTLVLPTGNGSADQALVTNGSGTLSFADRGRMTLATAQNSTSGTSIDFTGIPSWAKKITILFDRVSLSGSDNFLVQIGDSGGLENTGYLGCSSSAATTIGTTSATTGFIIVAGATAVTICGHMTITAISGNTWISSHVIGRSDAASTRYGGGTKTLSATLDRLSVVTDGTNTFDGGTINILYEG